MYKYSTKQIILPQKVNNKLNMKKTVSVFNQGKKSLLLKINNLCKRTQQINTIKLNKKYKLRVI